VTISLHELVGVPDAWGFENGKAVADEIARRVEADPDEVVIQLSLDGLVHVDASFFRESVVNVLKRFRGERYFCVVGVTSPAVVENLDAVALRREQPVTAWVGGECRILGPTPTAGLQPVLSHLVKSGATTTNETAAALGVSVPNASNKLKALWDQGYLLRRERTAPTGGIEHEYALIR